MNLRIGAIGFGLWLAAIAAGEPIPTPSGQYNVGVRRHTVDFINAGDPTSPNNVSTQYLATLYYPTEDDLPEPEPYLEPELAQLYTDLWDYNITHLTSTFRWNASFLAKSCGPTLLFGPGGWGPPTDGYGILISELVSRGYVVAAIDHIYEQPFLRLANGTGVYGLALDFPGDLPFIEALYQVRVREMLHFIDFLPELVAELDAPFETDGLGTFGHSLGGAAALEVAFLSDAVAAAINQDGTNFGRMNSTEDSDLKKPSMLLGFEQHIPENDSTWVNYMNWQSGWLRLFTVTGSSHLDWSDATFWKLFGTSRPLGPIEGNKMVDITNGYVVAFFEEHLRGVEQALLDEPNPEWPEVNYLYSSGD